MAFSPFLVSMSSGDRYSLKHKQDTPVAEHFRKKEHKWQFASFRSSGGRYNEKEFGEKMDSTAERGR